jgi:hypothetical protein
MPFPWPMSVVMMRERLQKWPWLPQTRSARKGLAVWFLWWLRIYCDHQVFLEVASRFLRTSM